MQDEVRGEARLALVAAVNYLARPGAAAVQDPAAYIYRSVTNAALRILQEKDLIRAPQSSQRKWAKDGRSDPRPKRHPLPVEELSYDIRAEIQGQSAFLDKILETCCETERERTVVELIANGGDVEDAADAIETSSQTVYRDLDAVEGRYETRFGRLKWLGAAYDAVQILSPRLFFRNEPFGENVEGLSHFGDKSCVVERQFKHTISRIRRFAS